MRQSTRADQTKELHRLSPTSGLPSTLSAFSIQIHLKIAALNCSGGLFKMKSLRYASIQRLIPSEKRGKRCRHESGKHPRGHDSLACWETVSVVLTVAT